MKKLVVLVAAVVAMLGLSGVTTQAWADHADVSPWCTDGVKYPGGEEIRILESPITLNIERGPQMVTVCYASNSESAPGGVTGGYIRVDYGVDVNTVAVTASVQCHEDPGVVFAPTCASGATGAAVGTLGASQTGPTTYVRDTGGPCLWVLGVQYLPSCGSMLQVAVANSDVPQASFSSTTSCLLDLPGGTGCIYFTGIKVKAGQDATNDTVVVTAGSTSEEANLPKLCTALFMPCAPDEG